MKYTSSFVVFICAATIGLSLLVAAPEDATPYTFASRRQVNHIDHVNVRLEVNGDVLTKSGSVDTPERQEFDSCLRPRL